MDKDYTTRGISIIIPNYNSSYYLANLLPSIEKARGNISRVEVLVVDASSADESAATKALCERYGAQYLYLVGNLAEKRNYGIVHSTCEVVFFTDSDCLLSSNTLAEHMKLYEKGNDVGAMCGVVEFVGPDSWMWSVVERTGYLGSFIFAKKMPYAPWAGTGNLSVRRNVLREINGFDEAFLHSVGQALGGEDVDLGLRINKAGYKIACNPNAVVYHARDTWNTFRKMHRRGFTYGRSHYHMIVKHADQGGNEYPRFPVIYFSVAFLAILKTILTGEWYHLLALPLFVLTYMTVQAVLVLPKARQSIKAIVTEITAYILDSAFEWGIVYESLRKKDSRGLWAKLIYSERQLFHERDRKIIQSWSLVAGFLAVILLG